MSKEVEHEAKEKADRAESALAARASVAERTIEGDIEDSLDRDKAQLKREVEQVGQRLDDKLESAEANVSLSLLNHYHAWGQRMSAEFPHLYRWRHLGLLALMNVLIYLAYTGAITHVYRVLGGQYLQNVNTAYLHQSAEHSGEMLAMISEIKMMLSVLQSSQGGINFFIDVEVQLGQALKPLADSIEYVWHFSVAALAAVGALDIALSVSALLMTPTLTLLLILIGLYCALGQKSLPQSAFAARILLFKCAKTLFLFVLIAHVLIPASLYTTALLSGSVLAKQHHDVRQTVSNFHTKFALHETKKGLKSQVSKSIAHFKDKQHELKHAHRPIARSAAKHMMLVLVEFILAPLLIFYFSLRLALRALRQWNIEKPR